MTVAKGAEVTCTITNTRDTAELTLVKKVSGGTSVVADWTLTATGPSTITGKTTDPAVTGATVPTGTFNLTESGPANYSPSAWVCTGATSQTATSVTLAKGAKATYTITNTRDTAELTLVKKVSGGTSVVADWTLTATGPSTITGKTTDPAVTGATVPTGTFNLTESGPANYSPSAWVCTGATSQTATSVTLAKGAKATCTITNTRDTAELTLVKKVSGGTSVVADWTLTATGPSTITGKTTDPAVTGATVPTGTFNLTESGPANYSPSAWVCTGATSQTATSVTLAKGAKATCTITNTRDTAQLLLVKKVSGGSSVAGDWTMTATDGAAGPDYSAKGDATAFVDVWAGTAYTLGESGPDNYTAGSWTCDSEVTVVGGKITLAKGAKVTCEITNTRDTAEVKLQKAWVNARGGDTAALTIAGGISGSPKATSTAIGGTGPDTTNVANATVQVGDTVTVTEVLGASNVGKYGSTLACTAGDVKVKVDDKGNFQMPEAAVTCTFTNDRSVVVPTQPTVTAEICDPSVPGAQLPGSITIPANPDYAYFVNGVATAAGTYPKPAGSYQVVAQLIVTKPVSASALQQLAAQDVYTWTVVIPGSPVCPILTKESSAGTGSVITGQTVGYTITVKNGGDTAVVGETLVDTLPAGVDLITTSINPSSGVYNSTARTITWKFDLPAAVGTTPATATFTYQVTVTAGSGSIVNSVSWVERSLTATTTNPVEPAVVGGVEETPDEPGSVVGGSEDLPKTGADNTVNVAGFGLLAMVLGGLMVGFGRRRRREE